ncbi:cytochrome P450 [Hypoxylon cercidicola]|nr:cytochrome P450 [Hypoxylon cercidicola]
MPSIIVITVASITAAYVLLRALAVFTRNPREPKEFVGTIPFISPLVGMLYEKGGCYIRMRDEYSFPIYTLRVPGPPLYVVNSLSLLQRIDRHILTVAFSPIQARACDKAMAVSKAGMDKIAGEKRLTEDGYLRSFPRSTAPAASPGPGLDALNRPATKNFAASFDRLASQDRPTIRLFDWVRHEIFAATMDATYGPHNPFRNAKNEEAWFEYESGIMALLMDFMPNVFARRSVKARDVLVAELKRYFEENRHLDGSLLVQLRQKHNSAFGLDLSDIAHTEIGQVAAGIILADPVIYEDCRREIDQLVQTGPDNVCTIDLAQIRTQCPILVSTWQEVLRFHGISIAARIIQEDTLVDNQYFLKNGGVVLIPNAVIHSDKSLWGPTTDQFNHKRFLGTRKDGGTRYPAAAFRGFGGGHVLCPGRHFASTAVLALVALLIARFDVRPIGGKWIEPKNNMVMDRACPLPKKDVEVELIPRGNQKWRATFSNNDKGINIVAEDLANGEI